MQQIIVITPQQLTEIVTSVVTQTLAGINLNAHAGPEILDRAQAAELLGIGLSTLDRYVIDGKVTAHKIGSRTRFYRTELMDSLKAVKRYARTK